MTCSSQYLPNSTWWPSSAPWAYDASLLPAGAEYETLAPAWYSDGLGAHEWPKHGRCAAWADASGAVKGLDQAGYYAAMFDIAAKAGTPDALLAAQGDAVPLQDLQARSALTVAVTPLRV